MIRTQPEVKVIAMSSGADSGSVITTLQLRYWRSIHSQVMTHRMFSRNAASSRAKPTKHFLKEAWSTPWGPSHWGKLQKGMKARQEHRGFRVKLAKLLWVMAARTACVFAFLFWKLKFHKQFVNRILEPFTSVDVIITATEWNNFFDQRIHADAQPEILTLAIKMRDAIKGYRPKLLNTGEWHLPYILTHEREMLPLELQKAVSVARCARVSYKPFDSDSPNVDADMALFMELRMAEPPHASPFEHVAQAMSSLTWHDNFLGWASMRNTEKLALAT